MYQLIKNGQVLIDGQLQKRDIAIDSNGQIAAMAPTITTLPANPRAIYDAQNNFISPGLIDSHVHFRDPGFTTKETLQTGSAAAAHGGFTSVIAMPNLSPVPDNLPNFEQLIVRNQVESSIHTYQFAPITQGLVQPTLVNLSAFKASGAVGFTNDGHGVQTAQTMYQAMQKAAQIGLPIVAHVEDESLVNGGVINAGPAAKRLSVPGISNVSESAQAARDIELARATGVHYHICHISTKETVNLVRRAKQDGINITCEVTPHHLLLDETAITSDNALFKMNPPLRSLADRQALWCGLIDGTIDIIATDHAPHTTSEKQQSLLHAPFGIVGSETAFSLLYTTLVVNGPFSLAQLISWLTAKPANIFKLPQAGQLAVGQPADIAVFNLNDTTTIDTTTFLSKGHNTPFLGTKVQGTTMLTLVTGQTAYQKE
ncbi:dihydroorotase [Latilactobacillus graminis]|uniref:Dihydroorotase n=2 Tax=Latilactobacillus graminis TaxID=60519 RepID=A0AA89L056_9LACO|nr:dihydroorotase [Latilactobacillus graminis]KRM22204.1 dihydroorotase [Latilactobacillus graminis DSM 20719]QFP79618.1 dihydroorotase [Latilactobacillus graminis]